MTPPGRAVRYDVRGVRRLDPDHPDDDADTVVVADGRIRWIGTRDAAPARGPDGAAPEVVTLDGFLAPAFVDAHVHATATGLAEDGVDLAGAGSVADVLRRLQRHAHRHPGQDPVLGGPWDDSGWPEGRPPTAREVAQALPGRRVLLERVDSHSLVTDPETVADVLHAANFHGVDDAAHVDRDARGRPTGWMKESAAEEARRVVMARLTPDRLDAARRRVCARAARLGIASLHEMGHPGLAGLADAQAWAAGEWPVEVLVWWAELDASAGPRHGLRSGGDLFLDGSIGSHTAAVSVPYADTGGTGQLFHSDDAVRDFFAAATCAGRGAGVHAIGDRAIAQAMDALDAVADVQGREAVCTARHRLEHVELPSPDHQRRMARLGVVASMQPAFDATWGGQDGVYATRFGAETALATNPLSDLATAGVVLAFGSDSTVTPLDPWGGVRAAVHHRGGRGLDRRTALAAHTIGGRFAARQEAVVGPVQTGLRADLAVWDTDPLATAATDRTATAPTCLRTVVAGVRAHVA